MRGNRRRLYRVAGSRPPRHRIRSRCGRSRVSSLPHSMQHRENRRRKAACRAREPKHQHGNRSRNAAASVEGVHRAAAADKKHVGTFERSPLKNGRRPRAAAPVKEGESERDSREDRAAAADCDEVPGGRAARGRSRNDDDGVRAAAVRRQTGDAADDVERPRLRAVRD